MNNLAENQELQNEVVQEDNNDGFEVEIVDDVAPEDKPRRPDNPDLELPEGDEVSQYSEGVQKRFNKLTFEAKEQKRQREEALRVQEEAIRYAETMRAENERLKKDLDTGEVTLIDQAKARNLSQLEKAEAEMKSAHEIGDSDALIAAQKKLNSIQIEQEKINSYRPQKRVQEKVAPQPQYTQQTATPQKPDERGLKWAENNTWFGEHSPDYDSEMTGYAYGLHERLVKSGVDPRSKAYYEEIDTNVRRVFPDKFDDGHIEVTPTRQSGSVVAAPSRTTKKPRTVKLSPSQASLAKRLGLTNEQYAAQVMKDMSK